ncbi:hypothetical protein [Mariniflexile sp.]|uniref:hypothetical protein n=1 Tax=Mariniflexile sp. TaxID=1979402 RepID=UPI0040476A3D
MNNIKNLEELDEFDLIEIDGGSELTEAIAFGVGATIHATSHMLRVTSQSYMYVLSWFS